MALSDIISALTEGDTTLNSILCAKHDKKYWLQNKVYTYLEIFADMSSIDVLNYESREEFKGLLKEIYEAYRELIE